jgi:hypothetical protein
LCDIGDGDLTLFELRGPTKGNIGGYFWTSSMEDGRLALSGAGLQEEKDYSCLGLLPGKVYSFKDGVMSEEKERLKVKSTTKEAERPKFKYRPIKSRYDWYDDYKKAAKYQEEEDEEAYFEEKALRYG